MIGTPVARTTLQQSYDVSSSPQITGDMKIVGSHEITKAIRTSAVETITAATDTLDDTNYFVRGDCTSNAITLTLPAASGNTGLTYIIKKVDSTGNSLTIDGNASETIDGSTTAVISSQYDSITIICNGTNWDIV
jgi:hypothetical protein